VGPLSLDHAQQRLPGEIEWLHIFTIRDGKVVSWRGHNDTAHLVAAWRAEPAAGVQRAANG
jgi:limonene-1,2-epoxide hydrolase